MHWSKNCSRYSICFMPLLCDVGSILNAVFACFCTGRMHLQFYLFRTIIFYVLFPQCKFERVLLLHARVFLLISAFFFFFFFLLSWLDQHYYVYFNEPCISYSLAIRHALRHREFDCVADIIPYILLGSWDRIVVSII